MGKKKDETPEQPERYRPPEMDKFHEGLDALHRGDYEEAARIMREAQEIQRKDGRG